MNVITPWLVGDEAEIAAPDMYGGLRDVQRVRVLKLYTLNGGTPGAWVKELPDGREYQVGLHALTCDPETELRNASAWRDAGGRINEARRTS